MNTVILGTGQLGLAIMDELVKDERHGVTLVNRSGRVGETLPAGVALVTADVTDAAQVARVTTGADVVFLCAQPPYHEWPEKFPPLVAAVIDGVARSGGKLIFGDNLYMYGSTGGAPIREDLPYAAPGHKGRTRAKMAEMLLNAHEKGRLPVAIGRASDFYGPRVTGSVLGEIVFKPALEGGTINLIGSPDLPHTYTYIRDFARALITLAEREEALGRAWHVPNAPTRTTREIIEQIAQMTGRPVKIRAAGRLMVRFLGLFDKMINEYNEMYYEFDEPYVVDHSRFTDAFGPHPEPTPWAEGLRETIEWYRRE